MVVASPAALARWAPELARPAAVRTESTAGGVADGTLALWWVMTAYALDAVGFLPHTLFWVDFLAREQGLGISAAANQWALFGIGAISGPVLVGRIAQRLGCGRALIIAFLLKTLAVALPLCSGDPLARSVSSLVVGAMVPGIVALVSVRIAELVGVREHRRYWGLATVIFAVTQAAAGYGLTALYAAWGSYYPLFAIGSSALGMGLVLVVLADVIRQAPQRHISRISQQPENFR